jgi:hypothetical protein
MPQASSLPQAGAEQALGLKGAKVGGAGETGIPRDESTCPVHGADSRVYG